MSTQFFFGAMSPYSWLAAERIDDFLPDARWRAVVLGGIFKANGRTSWGLTDEREANMADCEARARDRGLGEIRWPDPWPTSDLLVARAMTVAEARGRLRPYALTVMRMAFKEGHDIAQLAVVLQAARRVGIATDDVEIGVGDRYIKEGLRTTTEEAIGLGVAGVPTFEVDGTLYWGDDRLEEAAAAARGAA